ncbi:MAG TPA: DUF2520 domain-containing protein [Myxococcota bacterium]|nr:DUF2520 domain-containing protein [Myxococcota bacterium]
MNVAFFGGSFDPPHLSHSQVVRWLAGSGEFDLVLVVPCFSHAFDKGMAPFADRVAMCGLAFGDIDPRVRISQIESELPAPSFTVDTLAALQERNPDWRMRLVAGSDIPLETDRWKDFDRVARLAPPIFVNRGIADVPDAPVFPRVSSTTVRRRLAAGLGCGDLVVPAIDDFIRDHGLYGRGAATKPGIVVCGCGRVGTPLACSLAAAGWPVTVVDHPGILANRELPESIVRRTDVADAVPPGSAVWFICTGDDQVSAAIAAIDKVADPLLDRCVVTSASVPLENVARNMDVCRAHPLRAFGPVDGMKGVASGQVFALSGANADIHAILESIGARSFDLDPADAATYHAAAILASNLPGALAWQATKMFADCNVPDPWQATLSLMDSMIGNLKVGGPLALSGPAARGDRAAVSRIQAAIEQADPCFARVYEILSAVISDEMFKQRPDDKPAGENNERIKR